MPTNKQYEEKEIIPVEPGREAEPGEYDRTEKFEEMPEGVAEIDIATGKTLREEHIDEPAGEVKKT